MKKTVRIQNGKQPADGSYKRLIKQVDSFDQHINSLTNTRNSLVKAIKHNFNKTDENIEFELRKLRKD